MSLTKVPNEMLATPALGGNLLRITSFTSSGTWTKQADVSKVLVFCVGGGGGGASTGTGGTGGTTSFGSYSSANGGLGGIAGTLSNTPYSVSGGTTGVGDVILRGTPCGRRSYNTDATASTSDHHGGGFGVSSIPGYGYGGDPGHISSNAARTSGGGGATSMSLLDSASLTATVSVTIGAGGAAGSTGGMAATAGASGIVIIYEYGS